MSIDRFVLAFAGLMILLSLLLTVLLNLVVRWLGK